MSKIDRSEFICPEWCRTFYEDLLDTAERKGVEVVWLTKGKTNGFSVRTVRDGAPVKLLDGYPPGAYRKQEPAVYFYLESFKKPEVVRRAIEGVSLFQPSGEIGYKMFIDQADLISAREALAHIWELVDRIRNMP